LFPKRRTKGADKSIEAIIVVINELWMDKKSLSCAGGNRSIRLSTLAETGFAPAVKNPLNQVVGNRIIVVNTLMTLFAFPHSTKR
jgi:hypothetical protein